MKIFQPLLRLGHDFELIDLCGWMSIDMFMMNYVHLKHVLQ